MFNIIAILINSIAMFIMYVIFFKKTVKII
jgi:hypothetical protein